MTTTARTLAQITAEPARSRQRVAEHKRAIGAEIRKLGEPVRRLIISKVVLRNFKSYGGTTVIGPFHKRFTSIVGPNGSGKSNVIDAMLFVFGFRAKQMRFDKLSDLIHNSQAYLQLNGDKPLDSMEVAVHFCEIIDRDPDVDDFEVVPGSELVIAREVHRDNTSKYRINGRTATQKDVSNSLKSFGMDLYNNRFLILQGEVEQIAQMKPKATKPDEEGLLEYLEDIIGTNQYLEAIREAQKEYEEMQEQCQERFNRARVAQKEVEDLLEPKREADEYIAKEKALLQAQQALVRKEMTVIMQQRDDSAAQLDKLEQEFRDSTAELEALHNKRSEAVQCIQEVERELQATTKVQKRLNDSLQKMVAKDEDLRKQLLREVKKVEEKTAAIKRAGGNRPKLEQEAREKLNRSEELLNQLPVLQQELDKTETDLEVLTEQLKPELMAANRELAKRESELAPMQVAYDQTQKDISVTKSSIELLENRRKEGENNLNILKDAEKKMSESIRQHRTILEQDKAELDQQRTAYDNCLKKINELEPAIRQKTKWCTQKRGEYESLKRELDEFMGSKDQYKYIMGLVASGKIRGVHGRLGDLGSIPPEYERAFMAAAGGQVDVLVVDNPDVASQVFDELRKRNLGRCSAMALSILNNDLRRQMDAFERVSLDGLPPDVQHLVHLVQPTQPIYKVCFFSAIRDTLLAPDLDVASGVGYTFRRRVVTLNGELIEPDGRMCGGGVKAKKGGGIHRSGGSSVTTQGGTKPFVDAAHLEVVFKELEREASELAHMKEDFAQYTLKENTLSKSISELQYNLDVMQHNTVNEEVQLAEITERLKKLETSKQYVEDEEQLEIMLERLKVLEESAACAAERVAAQEKVVANAYAAVNSVGKGKLRHAKKRVEEVEAKLAEARGAMEQLRRDAAALQADADKCARDAEKFTREIEQHKVREKDLERQLNDLEEEAAAVSNEMNGVGIKAEALKTKLRELNDDMVAKKKLIEGHDLRSLDMRHNIDELSKRLRTCDLRLEERQTRLKDLVESLRKTCALIQSSEEAQAMVDNAVDTTSSISVKQHVISEAGGSSTNIDGDVDKMEDEMAITARREGTAQEKGSDANRADTDEITHIKTEPCGSGVITASGGLTNVFADDPGTTRDSQFEKLDVKQLSDLVERLRKEAGSVPNLGVIDDFRMKAHEYNRKRQELRIVQERRDESKHSFDQLCFKRKNEFMQNFAIIAAKLKEMYQSITLGGDAELELVDSTDPFTEGILFSVRPARKSWKQIQNLSGGEKTLSSLALVFALHHYKPNPVYFMDEIDAALDFRNVSIIAQSIRERTKDAQFIIISLRSQMFELCNQMVGIYKTSDVTKSLSGVVMENLFTDDESPQENACDQTGVAGDLGRFSVDSVVNAEIDEGIDICSSEALLGIVAKDPKALIPTILPGPIDSRVVESSIVEFFSTPGTHFMHIQMPNVMPCLDKDRTLRETKPGPRERFSSKRIVQHAISDDPEGSFTYRTSRIGSLPSGRMGRLRIHRSGRIRLHIGGHVFNFARGNRLTCKHQVGCFLDENDEFLFLGNYRKKFVVSPDFQTMWRK
ncbi:Structural maintenance of chromosomes protein 4 [Babesia sp. Xinjiang]|uniref:Structural maintenance of chromosomes protein 4 n=1 Tax=Babesia sp. Xinjiang TaxID=462227 RepID=UPI000A2458E9|nr:Structural maintenance of chromosomes protein 4 [Babesia sp. Xinjiang]ORM41814.1 Structural maintenance of chromosomes protein 4 [Babesia sp. Xinjiang]